MSTKRKVNLTILAFLLVAFLTLSPPALQAASPQHPYISEVTVMYLSGSPALQAAGAPEDSNQISALLSKARVDAVQLQQDSSAMEFFPRSLSWETHVARIAQIKDRANKVVSTARKLIEVRSTNSPRQQATIDSIVPTLNALVANVEATIAHLNENRQNLQGCVSMDTEYRDHLKANNELAKRLAALVKEKF